MKTYRKTSYKRKPTRRNAYRKTFRRTLYNKRPAFNYNSYVKINRTYLGATFQGDGVSGTQLANFQFAMSSLPNATEFTSLFDQFKINLVKMTFMLGTDYGGSAIPVNNIPRMYYVQDFDGQLTGVPSSINDLREYSGCKQWLFNTNKPCVVWIKPRLLNWIYRTGGVTEATVPMTPKFISTNYADTLHSGLRVGIENFLDPDHQIRVEVQLFMTLRNAK